MIVKDVDSITTTDKFIKAGLSAEKTLAFYLSREFKDAKDVLVLNDLRLESDNDSTQIDHLIIHKYGMVIIESKSAVGTIKINDYGEWYRLEYNRGMASPLEQAKRQATFLKKYLDKSGLKPPRDAFKSLVRRITFDDVPVDVLVAISDTGIIDRPPTLQLDKIHKADMIAGKVKEIITSYQKLDSPFSLTLTPTPLRIKPESMDAIAQFLKAKHVPRQKHVRLQARQDKVTYTAPAPVKRKFICRKCGSDDLSILYSFSYYFKCKRCNENMPIKEHCPSCGRQSKLRKDRNQFYIECKECNTSTPFFKNTS